MNISQITRWALTERVRVTVLDTENMAVLIERLAGPGAVVASADWDGRYFLNGIDVTRQLSADQIEAFCGLSDAVLVGMPKVGDSAEVTAASQRR